MTAAHPVEFFPPWALEGYFVAILLIAGVEAGAQSMDTKIGGDSLSAASISVCFSSY